MRRTATGLSLRKMRGRKAAKSKGRSRTRTEGHKTSRTADLRRQLEQRTRELSETCARQDATAEVNSCPGNPKPMFDCILEKAHHDLRVAPCGSLRKRSR